MPEQDVYDGSENFLGGQDASKEPHLIPGNAYSSGVNIEVSSGALRPRYGALRHKLKFPSGGFKIDAYQTRDYRVIFEAGKFQAVAPYTIGNMAYAVVVISGIIFLVNLTSLEVTPLLLNGEPPLRESEPRINWSVADKYLVFFDYPSYPIILEGSSVRRADPLKNEVPISVLGTYNQNRLIIANPGGEWTAGDPTGSLFTPNAPITFNEVLESGALYYRQIFKIPTDFGSSQITAMTFLQAVDSSTGIGSLLVSTPLSVTSYATFQPRPNWQAGQFGTNFIYNAGFAGPRAYTNVNSDVFFQAHDGSLRSVSMSRDEQKTWSRVPISREVKNWIKFVDQSLIKYGSMGYFSNKLFVSVNPMRVPALTLKGFKTSDVTHGGMVVLGFDNQANLSNKTNPIWDGLWTGVRPMDYVTSGNRFFVIAKDPEFRNSLWEIDPQKRYDRSGANIRYIKSKAYLKSYDFKSPTQLKQLNSMSLSISNIKGDFRLETFFKPSESPKFLPWRTFTHNAPWRNCDLTDGKIRNYAGHSFKKLNLGSPTYKGEASCSPVTLESYRTFTEMEALLNITGADWSINLVALKAQAGEQAERIDSCKEYPPVILTKECDNDWAIGPFESCQTKVT